METNQTTAKLYYPEDLNCAVIALRFFQKRHKMRTGRKGALVKRFKIKDWSHYGICRDESRRWIKRARAAGWRGSVINAVMAKAEGQQ